MRRYTQLTREQRYQIYALKKAGHSQSRIAELLDVSKATICRELQRNQGQRGYRPKQADQKAWQRRSRDKPRRRIKAQSWVLNDSRLRLNWSPEQISGWLHRAGYPKVNHEWIYQYILADKNASGDLYRYFCCQKQRRKRYGVRERRGQLPDRTSIEARPAVIAKRSRVGDWELDTIIGKGHKPAIVSLTERRARMTLIAKVERKTADLAAAATIKLLKPYAEKVLTLTSD